MCTVIKVDIGFDIKSAYMLNTLIQLNQSNAYDATTDKECLLK